MKNSIALIVTILFLAASFRVAAQEGEGIHWLTPAQAEAKMKERPKKIFIDFYTSWCGWCKKMDAATYSNPSLAKYMNNNFYAIRFDAEMKESFHFMGKEYHFDPQYRANTFAVDFLKSQGQWGYPTTVFVMENMENPFVLPGYHVVKEMEFFIRYYGDNICKHKSQIDYQKEFVSNWEVVESPNVTPNMPPMH